MRYAIAQSVNKEDYVNDVLGTGAKPFDGFTTKGTLQRHLTEKDYAETVKSPLTYNPKEAKTLRKAKKALGKDKFTFTLNTEDTPDSKISAEFIKSQIENNLPCNG